MLILYTKMSYSKKIDYQVICLRLYLIRLTAN